MATTRSFARTFTKAAAGLALASALLAPALSGTAFADNDGDTSTESITRVVPYDGYLNFDGVVFNGTVDVIFTLYDSASGGDDVWSEEWSTAEGRPVTVTAGRFNVALGSFDDIEPIIADAGTVYLGMEVKLPEGNNYVALGGRQRLNPVPYAMWTAQASDFAVGGNLNVSDNLDVGGNLAVGQALSTVSSAMIGTSLTVGSNATFGGALFVNGDIEADDMVVDSVYTRSLVSDGDTVITGPITATSGAEISGDIIQDGDIESTGLIYAESSINSNRGFSTSGYGIFQGNVAVDGSLTVGGNVNLSDCRICLNTGRDLDDDDPDQLRYACVELTSNSVSPWVRYGDNQDDDNWYRLVFRCDGGGDESGSDGYW
ncbi:MAG: hypothetical protein ACE366_19005 [Bradymonadia bacterium]